MELVKEGFIFKPSGKFDWSRSHAQVPFSFEMEDRIRVFFATRDEFSRSSVSFIDIKKGEPSEILHTHDKPVFQKGNAGTFDDSGTMPSWFVRNNDELWMYYTAWNKSETASYRLSIGLAVSNDDGLTFERKFPGPIMDRSKDDPIWVGQPCVLKFGENDWRMWYLSCEKVEYINNHPEPYYVVKYATSTNGIDWRRDNETCIGFDNNTDAIGRPCVWVDDGVFKMLHSNRRASEYRTNKEMAYRIVYSESSDGKNWSKVNNSISIDKGSDSWNLIMNEYCSIYKFEDKLIVLYNGDGFGKSGFGYAQFKYSND